MKPARAVKCTSPISGPAGGFGEEALISGTPRNASVTMLSDGVLMRLNREHFVTLIASEVLRPVEFSQALRLADDGAIWLDLRFPEACAAYGFDRCENIPLSMLRLHNNRMRRDYSYIVCSDDAETSSIGAFLLAERGFDVHYLNAGMQALRAQYPERFCAGDEIERAEVFNFPGAEMLNVEGAFTQTTGEAAMNDDSDDDYPLENTILRIAQLTTAEEAETGMQEETPVDQYAQTMTGKELAGIIKQMRVEHTSLAVEQPTSTDAAPTANPPEQAAPAAEDAALAVPVMPDAAEDSVNAAPVAPKMRYVGNDTLPPGGKPDTPADAAPAIAADDALMEEISSVMRAVEKRLRVRIEAAVRARKTGIEAAYRKRLQRLREEMKQEIRKRETLIRTQLEDKYDKKEQLLRSYYKKLIAVANKISKQKAQLQHARKQFEVKLQSADRLYREVDEMRSLLSENIGYLDAETEELPQLPSSW